MRQRWWVCAPACVVVGCGGSIAPESATPDGAVAAEAATGPEAGTRGEGQVVFDAPPPGDAELAPRDAGYVDATVAEGGVAPADAMFVETSTRPRADVCVPATCASLGYECGAAADGCGGVLQCSSSSSGACPPGTFCGGGGFNKCGAGGACPGHVIETPLTCETARLDCGPSGDGFGGLLDCGTCPPALVCSANKCVPKVDSGPCVPATCADYGANCGSVGDGCGGVLDCGACPSPQCCGGGGSRRCGGACADVPVSMQADCGVQTVCTPDVPDAAVADY